MDSTIKTPLISVIMPAYNVQDYIQEAIDSVLLQTFINWELIIIDDGSTDRTAEIIKENKNKDNRIKYFYQDNQGQSEARNLGFSKANGKYVAFFDSDDICFLERFTKQISFLETNEEVVVIGSWFSIIGSDRVIKLPEYNDAIRLALLSGNCIALSSVMVRKKSLEDFKLVFEKSKEPAEDYDLWFRLIMKGKFYNLQEVLIDYRTHSDQVSKKQNVKQKKTSIEIKRSMFDLLEFDLLPEEHKIFEGILSEGEGILFKDFSIYKNIQLKLLASNTKCFFEMKEFEKEILYMDKMFVKSSFLKIIEFNPGTYFNYLKIKSKLIYRLSFKDEFKLAIKSILFYKLK